MHPHYHHTVSACGRSQNSGICQHHHISKRIHTIQVKSDTIPHEGQVGLAKHRISIYPNIEMKGEHTVTSIYIRILKRLQIGTCNRVRLSMNHQRQVVFKNCSVQRPVSGRIHRHLHHHNAVHSAGKRKNRGISKDYRNAWIFVKSESDTVPNQRKFTLANHRIRLNHNIV